MEKSFSEQVSDLAGEIGKYINLRFDYFKLSMGDRIVKFFAFIMLRSLVLYIIFFVMFFLGMAFSIWFGEVTGRMYLGYLLTAAIFIILGVMVFMLRKYLIDNPLTQAYFKITGLEEEKEHEDET